MSKIPNIFLIGPMGSGKSTIGRILARELRLDFYDSDHVIEQRTGVTIPWIFDVEGEAGFRERERQVIDALTQKQNIVMATGGGAVLTTENRISLASRGLVVYLQVSIQEQIARTEKSSNRPLIQQQDLRESLEKLNSVREPHYLEIADLVFDTNLSSAQTVVKEIITTVRTGEQET